MNPERRNSSHNSKQSMIFCLALSANGSSKSSHQSTKLPAKGDTPESIIASNPQARDVIRNSLNRKTSLPLENAEPICLGCLGGSSKQRVCRHCTLQHSSPHQAAKPVIEITKR